MDYLTLFKLFDSCNIGVLLISSDNCIQDLNVSASLFLQCDRDLIGFSIQEIFDSDTFQMLQSILIQISGSDTETVSRLDRSAESPAIINCGQFERANFINISFSKYIEPLSCICSDQLPEHTYLLTIKDSTNRFLHYVTKEIFDRLDEAVTVWDSSCRILMLNKAAEKLESHLSDDVLGKDSATLYKADENSILAIPNVLKNKKPLLDLRQDFFTNSGKELEIVSNNYPVISNGKAIAAYSMMEDHSSITELHHRIGELQRALTNADSLGKPSSNEGMSACFTFNDIIYNSKQIRILIERSKMIAMSDSSVLIYGETGTGKEMYAQSIHNASKRKNAPFLAINCAAIPESLLESTLFGTEKGAYTGSVQRKGLLELAHNGTLLLDEINSMDIQLQAKLLRFLQEGEFRRVGGNKNIHVDVRIIANTNVPPLEAIEKKQIRSDLYYRIGIANITIPPLRKRKEDIPTLVQAFILKARKKTGKNVIGIDKHVLSLFFSYDWPGNVRELQHAIEFSMTIIPYDMRYITPEYLPDHIINATKTDVVVANAVPEENLVKAASQKAAKTLILQTLRVKKNNITETAKALGISRQNLQRYMKSLEIGGR